MSDRIEQLARQLVDGGIHSAFGVTGSGLSWKLITTLEDLGIRYYGTSHEAAAAIMAGTVARLTGRPATAIGIRGPGLANMLPGIVHNAFEQNPALGITEALGSSVPAYRRHKRMDHGALLSGVVKDYGTLGRPADVTALLATARREVPGPVHLDLCDGEGATVSDTRPQPMHLAADPAMREAAIARVRERIRRAERPLLCVGSLAARRTWQIDLSSLTIPVLTTAAAKGVLDEGLPHCAGVFTGDGKALAPESHLVAAADLVVGLGLRNSEVLSPKPFGRPTLLCDEVDDHLADGFQADGLAIDPDLRWMGGILEELHGKHWGLDAVEALRNGMQNALLDAEWLPAHLFQVLNDLHCPHVICLDTGAFCTIGEHLWHAGPNCPFVGCSNGRAMGNGIPMAIGAAIGTGWPVLCAVGDGGMRCYPAEIGLAVAERLPICFLLLADGSYGSIAAVPHARPMSRRAVAIPQSSWWRAVEAMGCRACAVANQETLAEALQAWDRKTPLFIEARFDPEPYAAMTRQLR